MLRTTLSSLKKACSRGLVTGGSRGKPSIYQFTRSPAIRKKHQHRSAKDKDENDQQKKCLEIIDNCFAPLKLVEINQEIEEITDNEHMTKRERQRQVQTEKRENILSQCFGEPEKISITETSDYDKAEEELTYDKAEDKVEWNDEMKGLESSFCNKLKEKIKVDNVLVQSVVRRVRSYVYGRTDVDINGNEGAKDESGNKSKTSHTNFRTIHKFKGTVVYEDIKKIKKDETPEFNLITTVFKNIETRDGKTENPIFFKLESVSNECKAEKEKALKFKEQLLTDNVDINKVTSGERQKWNEMEPYLVQNRQNELFAEREKINFHDSETMNFNSAQDDPPKEKDSVESAKVDKLDHVEKVNSDIVELHTEQVNTEPPSSKEEKVELHETDKLKMNGTSKETLRAPNFRSSYFQKEENKEVGRLNFNPITKAENIGAIVSEEPLTDIFCWLSGCKVPAKAKHVEVLRPRSMNRFIEPTTLKAENKTHLHYSTIKKMGQNQSMDDKNEQKNNTPHIDEELKNKEIQNELPEEMSELHHYSPQIYTQTIHFEKPNKELAELYYGTKPNKKYDDENKLKMLQNITNSQMTEQDHYSTQIYMDAIMESQKLQKSEKASPKGNCKLATQPITEANIVLDNAIKTIHNLEKTLKTHNKVNSMHSINAYLKNKEPSNKFDIFEDKAILFKALRGRDNDRNPKNLLYFNTHVGKRRKQFSVRRKCSRNINALKKQNYYSRIPTKWIRNEVRKISKEFDEMFSLYLRKRCTLDRSARHRDGDGGLFECNATKFLKMTNVSHDKTAERYGEQRNYCEAPVTDFRSDIVDVTLRSGEGLVHDTNSDEDSNNLKGKVAKICLTNREALPLFYNEEFVSKGDSRNPLNSESVIKNKKSVDSITEYKNHKRRIIKLISNVTKLRGFLDYGKELRLDALNSLYETKHHKDKPFNDSKSSQTMKKLKLTSTVFNADFNATDDANSSGIQPIAPKHSLINVLGDYRWLSTSNTYDNAKNLDGSASKQYDKNQQIKPDTTQIPEKSTQNEETIKAVQNCNTSVEQGKEYLSGYKLHVKTTENDEIGIKNYNELKENQKHVIDSFMEIQAKEGAQKNKTTNVADNLRLIANFLKTESKPEGLIDVTQPDNCAIDPNDIEEQNLPQVEQISWGTVQKQTSPMVKDGLQFSQQDMKNYERYTHYFEPQCNTAPQNVYNNDNTPSEGTLQKQIKEINEENAPQNEEVKEMHHKLPKSEKQPYEQCYLNKESNLNEYHNNYAQSQNELPEPLTMRPEDCLSNEGQKSEFSYFNQQQNLQYITYYSQGAPVLQMEQTPSIHRAMTLDSYVWHYPKHQNEQNYQTCNTTQNIFHESPAKTDDQVVNETYYHTEEFKNSVMGGISKEEQDDNSYSYDENPIAQNQFEAEKQLNNYYYDSDQYHTTCNCIAQSLNDMPTERENEGSVMYQNNCQQSWNTNQCRNYYYTPSPHYNLQYPQNCNCNYGYPWPHTSFDHKNEETCQQCCVEDTSRTNEQKPDKENMEGEEESPSAMEETETPFRKTKINKLKTRSQSEEAEPNLEENVKLSELLDRVRRRNRLSNLAEVLNSHCPPELVKCDDKKHSDPKADLETQSRCPQCKREFCRTLSVKGRLEDSCSNCNAAENKRPGMAQMFLAAVLNLKKYIEGSDTSLNSSSDESNGQLDSESCLQTMNRIEASVEQFRPQKE